MNLTDHLMLRPVYKVKNLESLNDIYYSMTKKFMTGLKYLLFRKGPLTVGASYLVWLCQKVIHTWQLLIYSFTFLLQVQMY